MRRTTVSVCVALALVVAGCSGGSGKKAKPAKTTTSASPTVTVETQPPSSSTSTATTKPATTTTVCNFAGTTGSQRNAVPLATMLLTNVQPTPDGCLGRVTFTFRSTGADAAPGYRAEYQPGPFAEDGSGSPVTVAGSAFLVVRFEPAAGVDLSVEHAPQTYTGPRSIKPAGVPHVVEIREIGDFEGVVTWVIGLDSQRPVQTAAIPGPPTLTVTIG